MIAFNKNEFISILNNYPKPVVQTIRFILKQGFNLCVVGGGVRDFLLTGQKASDLDLEIRFQENLEDKLWQKKLESLFAELSKNYKVEKLNYSVFRIWIEDFELELASPRIEVYPSGVQEFGHSDFEVQLFSCPDYKDGFSRRDFTVNAIGIELGLNESDEFTATLIDPFQGLKDLNDKSLKPVGENFYKDPVRLLRAVRFSLELGFNFSPELLENLSLFNLKKVSHFYLKSEALKGSPAAFYKKLAELSQKFSIATPYEFKIVMKCCSAFKEKSQSAEELLWDVVSQTEITKGEVVELAKFFAIKEKVAKEFFSFKSYYEFVSQVDWSHFSLADQDLDKLNEKEIEKLTNLHRYFVSLKQLCSYDFIFTELDEHKIKSLASIAEQIDLLQKDKIFLEKRNKINNNLRTIYSLYYHFNQK